MPTLPEPRPTRLIDGRVAPPAPVPATLLRHVRPSDIPAVEAAWAPARRVLVAARQADGADLEHGHWDWVRKVPRVAAGNLVVYAIECERDVQGLMAAEVRPREAALTPGSALVYVDFLEAAPWNIRAGGHPPRFLGVGTALVGEAIRVSSELGLGGRVGLHSLPQAERFYEQRCGMVRVGPDPAYYNLTYFEYADGEGLNWLAAMGFTT